MNTTLENDLNGACSEAITSAINKGLDDAGERITHLQDVVREGTSVLQKIKSRSKNSGHVLESIPKKPAGIIEKEKAKEKEKEKEKENGNRDKEQTVRTRQWEDYLNRLNDVEHVIESRQKMIRDITTRMETSHTRVLSTFGK